MVGETLHVSALSIDDRALLDAARAARGRAHAPYSRYKVGAALRTSSGALWTGCNVEISSFSMTCCAERVAVFKAVSEGDPHVLTCVVVTDEAEPAAPCGACRQVLYDFGGGGVRMILANEGPVVRVVALGDLLPLGFGPDNLLHRT